jgi:hypothetical protein
VKTPDLSPLWRQLHELWTQLDQLFGEHHFITILCAFFAVMMTISFYRMLKSISPALVAFFCFLIFCILGLHWTITRTEPAILTPAIDFIAPFFPAPPEYPAGKKPTPGKSKTPPAKKVSRLDGYFFGTGSLSSATNSGEPRIFSQIGSSGSMIRGQKTD